jgi:alkylation response protein AidB-like acyl-CoA dehydrogenase
VDLSFSDDQRLLRESIERVLADRYDVPRRLAYLAEPRGFSEETWRTCAELGVLAVPFDERVGGLGGGAIEVMLIMESLGRAMAVEPYLPTVILGGGLLRRCGSPAQQKELIPKIIDGTLTLAVATTEPASGYDLARITTRARRVGAGWQLDGAKSVVLGAAAAERLIVPARVAGGEDEAVGIGLFMIDGGATGLGRRNYRLQDGLPAADLVLNSVPCEADACLGDPEGGYAPLAATVEDGIAALCAEAVGAMDRLFSLTLEFLKTRQQFGHPLGDFQALQHRAVDLYVALEQARSMALYATLMLAAADAAERSRAVSAAKASVGRAARQIGQEATQLHGAMGMTIDYPCGVLFKRLTMIDSTLGHHRHHTRELARLGGLPS